MDRRTLLTESLVGTTAAFFGTENLLLNMPKQSEHMVAKADSANGNRRIYPRAVLDKMVEQFKAMPPRSLIGQLGMPLDSIIHLADASHMVIDLRVTPFGHGLGDYLIAEIELLDTPCGVILKRLMESPGTVAFRTAGVGFGKVNYEGVMVVDESYKLISVNAIPAKDAVYI